MGTVYRAHDARLGRDAAIEVLPTRFRSDPSFLSRFEREARAAAAVSHPNVMALYDVGSHEGAPYLVCELLDGETLRAKLGRGSLPAARALDWARQIVRGLAAAHDRGLVHRDLNRRTSSSHATARSRSSISAWSRRHRLSTTRRLRSPRG
jgi:serine/threonine protein kinase